MAERLVRDLVIEQALQEEINDTLEHNNQLYGDWCNLSDEDKKRTRLNLPCNMIWAGRRDHLVGDTTPLQGMHQDLKKQTYNRQTTYHQYSFCEIFEHSNGLASTISFKCNREKHDKRLVSHQFNLHTPQQTINPSGDLRYRASKWYIP